MNSHHKLIQPKQQNVDLWEAWIDVQAASNGNSATLYVIGDVFTNNRLQQPYFAKKNHSEPGVLLLELFPAVVAEDAYLAEVMYSEELKNVDQYTAVLIYAGEELVTRIQDIETIA